MSVPHLYTIGGQVTIDLAMARVSSRARLTAVTRCRSASSSNPLTAADR
ncbi:hypothetical protein ABIH81_29965 [Micromonospora sp. HUAS YX12]|uniref:Uncharacterized protein n=1 Tax=Micromonospora sp. HUAS YX12 TaxID=3156396 RepID=A0AAU7R0T7_9ACTN